MFPVLDAGMDASGEPEPDASLADAGPVLDAGDAEPEPPDASIADATVPEPDAAAPNENCDALEGLYAPGSCTILAEGVRMYVPKYELWSDGADKVRHIYLPPNTQIDTANPDRWSFPVGTRLFKTFEVAGKKIETRAIVKVSDVEGAGIDNFSFVAYAWSEDQRSVGLAPATGVQNALGTNHDIPSQMQCRSCHNMRGLDAINGFGALQLNHIGAGVSLSELIGRGLLTNSAEPGRVPTTAESHFPGDARAQDAFGYLHANCGHCHGGPSPRVGLQLWTTVATTGLEDSPLFTTAACQCLQRWTGRETGFGGTYQYRLVPGHSQLSGIVGRMAVRTNPDGEPPVPRGEQMPPHGTEIVDVDGLMDVAGFIDSLDMGTCDPTVACPPPGMPASGAAPAMTGQAGAAP